VFGAIDTAYSRKDVDEKAPIICSKKIISICCQEKV